MGTWTGKAAALLIAATVSLSGCSGDPDETPAGPATVTVTETPRISETPTTSETQTVEEEATDLAKAPRTYDEAIEHFSAAFAVEDIPQELSRFETPTGNIYCVLDDESVPPGCEIGEGGVDDQSACPQSQTSVVGRIEWTEKGPQPVCNGDTIRLPGPPVLGYGGVASWPGLSIQCLVEEVGVTCLDTATEAGFFLARGRYQVF